MKFDLTRFSFDSGTFKVENILAPIYILGTIDIGGMIIFIVLSKTCPLWSAITEISCLFLFNLFACSIYWYFAKNDPDRLQSEKYQIQKHKLEIETQKYQKQPLSDYRPKLSLEDDSPEPIIIDSEEGEDK